MTAVQDPLLQRRRLRMELRRARDAADLKQADVARAMDWSPSKLIRIERGDVGISTNDLKALLTYYDVKDKRTVEHLLDLVRSSRGGSVYDPFSEVLKPGFKEYLAYEASASVIRQYDPVLISGLLQTEEYALAILEEAAGFGPEQAELAWQAREQRQQVHDRGDPPDMLFVVDEAAIRRQVGAGRVMRNQLERLREHAGTEHVTLRILPFSRGAHPGMLGSFIMLEFADVDLPDLVHLEQADLVTVRENTELVGEYLDKFARLEELALSPEESIAFLDQMIGDASRPQDPAISATKEVG